MRTYSFFAVVLVTIKVVLCAPFESKSVDVMSLKEVWFCHLRVMLLFVDVFVSPATSALSSCFVLYVVAALSPHDVDALYPPLHLFSHSAFRLCPALAARPDQTPAPAHLTSPSPRHPPNDNRYRLRQTTSTHLTTLVTSSNTIQTTHIVTFTTSQTTYTVTLPTTSATSTTAIVDSTSTALTTTTTYTPTTLSTSTSYATVEGGSTLVLYSEGAVTITVTEGTATSFVTETTTTPTSTSTTEATSKSITTATTA
ncbi:hypothetical protein M422DRAFT_244004 [Sphaerobolus stellatus SS14]|nr:hypothetical protein M422DRAFT_244004 [Sphaerobolus stellatus SS14]